MMEVLEQLLSELRTAAIQLEKQEQDLDRALLDVRTRRIAQQGAIEALQMAIQRMAQDQIANTDNTEKNGRLT